ncbi:MAG: extracellular solute-binding protein [Caldilineaceae bacterium]|nr:extracellular solute-binding protein [Caldilineaceae bacterium]HRJ41828.1 extracellular solute-binding protein [Caldilineaceae bacterium]
MKLCGWILTLTLSILLLAACQEATPTPTPEPPIPTSAPGEPAVAVSTATPAPQPTAPQTPTPTPEATSGTVTLWHSWARADGDALTQILENFAGANPAITVQTLYVAHNDLPQAYADAVAAGGGPDLILAPAWWLRELVEAGALLPLSDRLAAGESEQWMAPARDNLSIDGTLYGLPTNYELVGLYYNRSLVNEAELPATTDDLLALAAANPAQGAGLYLNFYHLYWGIPAYGGELFDAAGRVVLDRTPGTAHFLGWLGQLSQTPGSFVRPDYGMLIDRFKKGEFAFFVDGPWSSGDLRQALGDNLGVAPLPAGPAGPARPWLSGDGVFLNPIVEAAQQQLALHLARHIASGESGTILAQTAHRLPGHRDAQVTDPLLAAFIAQANTARPEPRQPAMSQVWGYAGDMLVKVIDGGISPAVAVTETTVLLNDALEK